MPVPGNRGQGKIKAKDSDFLTSQENALAHFQIVARASCPCYLEIFHGRKGPHKNNFTFWTQMHPARLRCENSKYRECSCVFAPGRAGAYTPNSVNLFLRGNCSGRLTVHAEFAAKSRSGIPARPRGVGGSAIPEQLLCANPKNVPTHFPKNSPNPLSRSGSLRLG